MVIEEPVETNVTEGYLHLGASLEHARGAMILLHGRGALHSGVAALAEKFIHQEIALIAPLAQFGSWYPNKYNAPIEQNEPAFSEGLNQIDNLLKAIHAKGIAYEKVIIAGYSQGACMALEYAVRNPRRYAGVIGYSGGLLGPELLMNKDCDHLSGVPVFVGCGDRDTHIQVGRIAETCKQFKTLGAEVEMRIYPDMGHTLNDEEISYARNLVADLAKVPVSMSK